MAFDDAMGFSFDDVMDNRLSSVEPHMCGPHSAVLLCMPPMTALLTFFGSAQRQFVVGRLSMVREKHTQLMLQKQGMNKITQNTK